MGTCVSRCFSTIHEQSLSVRTRYFGDHESLVEFDALMDETQPKKHPVSILPSHEKELVNNQLPPPVEEKEEQDDESLIQLAREEEELELQEESALDARREALRIQKLASNSEIINPARLAFDNNALWLGEDVANWNVAGEEYASKNSADNGNGASEKSADKRDRLTSASSPFSSVDLEWENESGLSPVTHMPGEEEDDIISDTASCLSQMSSPCSNGNEELEWDGHFTRWKRKHHSTSSLCRWLRCMIVQTESTHISQLDLETERLISEIERLTTDALNDAGSKR